MRTNRLEKQIRYLTISSAIVSSMVLLAWFSYQAYWSFDFSVQNKNTLSTASQSLLTRLDKPILVTAYVENDRELHKKIRALIQLYQHFYKNISLQIIDPKNNPQKIRQLDIHPTGEIVIEYAGHHEKIRAVNEQNLSNALLRLNNPDNQWVVFLEGHGERSPHKPGNQDLGLFAKNLQRRGLHIQSLNLNENPIIPDNTSTLVIASPKLGLSTNEIKLVLDYLDKGGNLLWLTEPGTNSNPAIELQPLKKYLGLHFLPGTVISASTVKLGIKNPAIIILQKYSVHPVHRNQQHGSLFPYAMAIQAENITDPQQNYQKEKWDFTPLLLTDPHSWTETGPLESPPLRFNPDTDEVAGPLIIGIAITRSISKPDAKTKKQRIIVIGDGDFLSNSFIANGGNQYLGNNLIHWLGNQDDFIEIPPPVAPDLDLVLSDTLITLYAFVFPFVIPLILVTTGFVIRYYRHRT